MRKLSNGHESARVNLYSVRSPTGGVIVSCHVDGSFSFKGRLTNLSNEQDFSRNGFTYNGQTIKKNSVILMDGDILGLPNNIGMYILERLVLEVADHT